MTEFDEVKACKAIRAAIDHMCEYYGDDVRKLSWFPSSRKEVWGGTRQCNAPK